MSLSVTELRKGTIFAESGVPFKVLEYTHTKIGRGTANIKVKVRNLKTGATIVKTFISGASVEEAEANPRKAQFLYLDTNEAHFMDAKTFEQFAIPKTAVEDATHFLPEGTEVTILFYEGEPLSIELPLKVDLKVAETGSADRGDTRGSATKKAVLETGYKLQVPMFIKIGDVIRVNTENGQYVERV